MAKQIIEARVKQKVDTESNWLNNELRLLDGEQAFVRTDAGVSVNFKIGDGNKTFSELPYFYPPLTLGSISTTQTLSQLNALADGVWVARGSGTFAFGLTAEEGYFTTFRKVGTQWTLNSRTEVLFTAPNIDWIEDQLENHERRITWNESVTRDHSTYIQGLTNNINVLDNVVRNLDETQIKMIGQYPELDNPTFQSSFNRRLFNYVKNSLDTSTNFKTNTFNNVTDQFGFGTGSYKFGQRSNGTTYMDVLGTRHAFRKDAFNVGKDDDNYMELNYDVLIGRVNGVRWGIRKDINQTRASNLQMPMTGSTFRTAVISVNGEYADENGNVVFSGGGGSGEYVLPIASAARLGGIRVGSGLTIGFDGTLNAVASSNIYTSNGTITDNRTVNLNNKTITFTNGGFKADKLTLLLMLENTTPLTIWADRNGKLKYTNKDGVTADIGAGGGGASYIAGVGITIDRNEISAKVDGTTITTNASGQLVAIGGGGGGGSFNPSGVNNVTNAFSLTSPTWSIKSDYAGDDSNVLTFDVGAGAKVSFNKSTGIRFDDSELDRAMYIEPSGISLQQDSENGLYIGLNGMITNKGEYTYPTQSGTMVMSVNGVQADATGNIVVSGGGATYTGANGIQISGSNVITPQYGTTSNTVAQGNDSRFPTTAEKTSWNNKLDKPTANAELASVVGFDAGGVSKKSEVVEIASSWTSGTAPTATQLTDAFPNAMFVMAVNLTVPKMYIKSGGGWKSVNLETVV